MKLAWLTDIHLNFLDIESRINFYHVITETQCDAILISGDIAEAPSIEEILKEIAKYVKNPIYFVLGNHDYYRGQVDEVRKKMRSLTKLNKLLNWLPAAGIQVLSNNTMLLGQDGWADGRYGDYANSRVSLNDSQMITDLFQHKIIGKYPLLKKMQQLADGDAEQLHADLTMAITDHPKKVIVVTHVPPFKEACTYEGKMSNNDFLPFFSSKVTGDVLLKIANENTNIEFLVLCGHTHGKADYQPLDNLSVKTGGAEYYKPELQDIINV